ncbi:MAG TPA: DUF3054 domain-containing protein [Ilumatobacter sp.]
MQPDRRLELAIGVDVFVVVLFVAIGRRTHDAGSALTGTLATAAPLLIGLAAAWGLVRAWRRPAAVATGLAIWPVTVLAGMVVRRLVFDRGTATAFVVVATLFLGAGLVGWRALLAAVQSSGGVFRAK